jgi:hypothetical protein
VQEPQSFLLRYRSHRPAAAREAVVGAASPSGPPGLEFTYHSQEGAKFQGAIDEHQI